MTPAKTHWTQQTTTPRAYAQDLGFRDLMRKLNTTEKRRSVDNRYYFNYFKNMIIIFYHIVISIIHIFLIFY